MTNLTPEQEHTLRAAYTALKCLAVYIESVAPIVCAEDELHIKHLLGFAAFCEHRLIENFECVAKSAESQKRGGL